MKQRRHRCKEWRHYLASQVDMEALLKAQASGEVVEVVPVRPTSDIHSFSVCPQCGNVCYVNTAGSTVECRARRS